MDWNDVVPAGEVDYVIGNPPFLGARNQSKEQKAELVDVFHGAKNCGNVDYVAGWYMKAAEYVESHPIRCAFVSTNSVCQGEQVANIWKPIWDLGFRIDFAHDTFRWNSQADDRAHVFCVIVGFSRLGGPKRLYHHVGPDAEAEVCMVSNLNAYLVNGPDAFISNRRKPLQEVPQVVFGSMPNDGGNLLLNDEDKQELLSKCPEAEAYIRPFIGSANWINGGSRWCIWLKDVNPRDILSMPRLHEIIQCVREFRTSSTRAATRRLADVPWLFGEIRQPDTQYIIVPRHSSERRRYVPLGMLEPNVICGDSAMLVPSDSLFVYGILQSQFHNAWMRVVCGRLKSDYRYSGGVVYNNFVWPDPTDAQRVEVARCAQAVLDARELYKDSKLADMYDPENDFLYPELAKAHRELDAAVEAAYGVDFDGDEEAIVAHLFKLYAEKVGHA